MKSPGARCLLGLVSACALGLAGACGSGGSNGGSNQGGDGGSSGGSSGSGAKTTYYGALEAFGSATTGYGIVGHFDLVPPILPTTPCPWQTVGACCYQPPLDGGSVPGTTGTLEGPPVSAGTITVTDGNATVASLVAEVQSPTEYRATPSNALHWSPGDQLTFSAPGDVVDAFTGSVTVVDDLVGVTPSLMGTGGLSVSTSADFTITWTPGTTSGAVVQLFIAGDDVDQAISCYVPDSVGTVTAPKSLLANFASGSTGTINVTRILVATATGGNVTTYLESQTDATNGLTTGGGANFTP